MRSRYAERRNDHTTKRTLVESTEGIPPRASLLDPYVKLSLHTAPDNLGLNEVDSKFANKNCSIFFVFEANKSDELDKEELETSGQFLLVYYQ